VNKDENEVVNKDGKKYTVTVMNAEKNEYQVAACNTFDGHTRNARRISKFQHN
jgi:hypothetical protein